MREQELTALFARLGARDPQNWARSQVQEGIPQLARYLFLRQAWKSVVAEDDLHWIDAQLKIPSTGPGGAVKDALQRALNDGASKADLTIIVRVMQWQLLHHICYLLDDPGDVEPEVRDVVWGLFEVDDQNAPIARISGLHESVLETEPTGREMRSS